MGDLPGWDSNCQPSDYRVVLMQNKATENVQVFRYNVCAYCMCILIGLLLKHLHEGRIGQWSPDHRSF